MSSFFQIDFPALIVAITASLICALVGSFLVLRRQALMGDALSHVVLPGIVAGYLFAGSIAFMPMFLGALAACMLSVALIATIRKTRIIEPGAAMGIVFTAMFALGVLLLEQQVGRRVHLDAHHALYGALELTYWPELKSWPDFFSPAVWAAVPREIPMLLSVLAMTVVLLLAFYKELKLSTFDPVLARILGFRPELISYALLGMTAIAAVAAFQAVGSILVIAMFICPAAAARLITDDLSLHLWLSCGFSVLMSVTGYALAVGAPYWLGVPAALNAAGMIALSGGLILWLAFLFQKYKAH